MMRRKVTQADVKRFPQEYREGKVSREFIAELERQSGQSIEEIVARIETAFSRKSHRVDGMTLPELRKWQKVKDSLSDAEKQAYADANDCTYEEFEHMAVEELKEREKRNYEKRMRSQIRQMQRHNAYMDRLVEEGKATTDGTCYVTTLDHILGY